MRMLLQKARQALLCLSCLLSPPPDSIVVGLFEDLLILLTGLDCPSLSLLSCRGTDLDSTAEG